MKTTIKVLLFPGGVVMAIIIGAYTAYMRWRGTTIREVWKRGETLMTKLIVPVSAVSWLVFLYYLHTKGYMLFLLYLLAALVMLKFLMSRIPADNGKNNNQ